MPTTHLAMIPRLAVFLIVPSGTRTNSAGRVHGATGLVGSSSPLISSLIFLSSVACRGAEARGCRLVVKVEWPASGRISDLSSPATDSNLARTDKSRGSASRRVGAVDAGDAGGHHHGVR